MSKAQKTLQLASAKRHKPLCIIIFVLIIAAVLSLILAETVNQPHILSANSNQLRSKIPYVDGTAATEQVANFYQQYINPRTPAPNKPKLIAAYGNKNLVFYSEYYQHGFDPITCSTKMPVKVSTSLVNTGPVATVRAITIDAAGVTTSITARVVLDDEGLSIDSITCPGGKGTLPVSSS